MKVRGSPKDKSALELLGISFWILWHINKYMKIFPISIPKSTFSTQSGISSKFIPYIYIYIYLLSIKFFLLLNDPYFQIKLITKLAQRIGRFDSKSFCLTTMGGKCTIELFFGLSYLWLGHFWIWPLWIKQLFYLFFFFDFELFNITT